MKKLLLLSIITILGLSSSAIAQNMDFGLKTGLNISNFTGGDADRNNIFSFHAGGFAEFKLNQKFSLQPEILYSRQGSEAKNTVKVKVDYLAIPLMTKYYLSKNISFEAGPQVSFLINDIWLSTSCSLLNTFLFSINLSFLNSIKLIIFS